MEIDYSNFVLAAYLVSAIALGLLALVSVGKYFSRKRKLKNVK